MLLAVAMCYSAPQSASASYCYVPLPLPNPRRANPVSPAVGELMVAELLLPDRKRGTVTAFGKRKLSAALFSAPGRVETAAAKSQELNGAGLSILSLETRPVKSKLGDMPLPSVNPKTPLEVELPARKPKDSDKSRVLKPLLDYKLSKANRNNLKAAMRAISKRRSEAARKAIRRIEDLTARKFAEWYYLRSWGSGASAEEIEAFRKANPHWPSQRLLRRRAEAALFVKSGNPEATIAFFRDEEPNSGIGKAALAGAYLKKGHQDKAKRLIVSAWRDHVLDKATQKLILKRFTSLLAPEDHKARIDKLLYQNRKSLIAPALRIAALLGKEEKKKVRARAAVIRGSKSAGKLLEKVSDDTFDAGLAFHTIQWLRRNDREPEAWELLKQVPTDPVSLVDADKWWIERKKNSRDALNTGCAEIAYRIASRHGPVSDKYLADAEFFAGWIALQLLDKPEVANRHFRAQRNVVVKPRAVARAEYWLGRVALVMGRLEDANRHFSNAGQHSHTFHGLLALQSRNPGSQELVVPATPKPTKEDIKRLLDRDAVKALGIVRTAGLEKFTRTFLYQLGRTLESPAEIGLIAEYARIIDKRQASIRLSKVAFNRGLALGEYAFPTDVIPPYRRLNDGVEEGLIYALTRQESEFNVKAKSRAGARGLMQLMPRTARSIARSYKIRYRKAKLTKDGSYNVMLGSAHLRDLVDDFGGSYIMAIASYNAGGPRVMQWIGAFGNPRDPETDPLDWIERIPFTETRRYVRKVLFGMQVYRARLEGSENALQILQDLSRGKRRHVLTSVAEDISSRGASPCHIIAPDRSTQLICF